MSETVVRVDRLSKKYRLGAAKERYSTLGDQVRKWTSLRRLLRRGRRAEAGTDFWALKDVSFEINRGEAVGIIGRNGAGKSTLLKILSRITEPTTGEADIHGRVGSLLEVGTGFHPELTGRENIYLNGAILGMRRAEIVRQFDAIVQFAEVDRFVDTPVKHYSSGMYTRLAFAVAAHLEPEILVVDEVLAVGDAQFQKKCLGKMGDVARGGRTVLFVSHNMAAVRSLCRTAILLDRGQVKQVGDVDGVVREYLLAGQESAGQFSTSGRRFQPANCEIVEGWLERDGARVESLLFEDRVDVVLRVAVAAPIRFAVELILRQQDGVAVAFAPSGLATGWTLERAPGTATIRCRLPPARLASGRYTIDLITAVSGFQFLDYLESGLTFTVDSTAIGERNWLFTQARGQGHLAWDVTFAADEAPASGA